MFAAADESSGRKRLRQFAQGELKDLSGCADRITQLGSSLGHDATFARSLEKRPVPLGYDFASDRAPGLGWVPQTYRARG